MRIKIVLYSGLKNSIIDFFMNVKSEVIEIFINYLQIRLNKVKIFCRGVFETVVVFAQIIKSNIK